MNDPKPKKKSLPFLAQVLIASALVIGAYKWLIPSMRGSPDDPNIPAEDLAAVINFDGAKFEFTNANSYDWSACKAVLNGEWELAPFNLSSGRSATVGAMQFHKANGERFNPIASKPLEMALHCKNRVSGLDTDIKHWQ